MADIIITPGSSLMSFTSSLNYTQTLAQEASGSLTLQGSGSTGRTDLFTVNGNNGTLFSVSDDLSNSLFSVNTIAGLPVIEAFADNTVVMGQYGQNVLVVTGSRVGIGVSNPSAKLQVIGSFGLNGADSNFPFFVSDSSTSSRYTLTNKGMGFNLSDDYAQLQLYGGNGGYIDFVNAAQDYNARIIYYGGSRLDLVYGTTLSITAGGNVGIGNNSPSAKLHINVGADGTAIITDYSSTSDRVYQGFDGTGGYFELNGSSTSRQKLRFQVYNGSSYTQLFINGGNENIYTSNNANVGIGTSSPSEKLDVNGKTKTTTLQVTSGATAGYVLTSDASGNGTWQAAASGGGGGIHLLAKPQTGWKYTNYTEYYSSVTPYSNANFMIFTLFAPANNLRITETFVNVTTAAVNTVNGKIIVYTDENNGYPSTLVIESSNLSLNTTGVKTYLVNYTFEAGKKYWLGFITDVADSTLQLTSPGNNARYIRTFNPNIAQTQMYISATYSSVPSTNTFVGTTSLTAPTVFFTSA